MEVIIPSLMLTNSTDFEDTDFEDDFDDELDSFDDDDEN